MQNRKLSSLKMHWQNDQGQRIQSQPLLPIPRIRIPQVLWHLWRILEFKVKLTPKDDKVVYSQNPSMLVHLKENLILEIALMRKFWIIKILPFSRNASTLFAKRKPNGKLRLLVDLRKINRVTAENYTHIRHPVSILSDAAKLVVKSLSCKLDFSHLYQCL